MALHHRARTRAVGGVPTSNGRVGAGEPPPDRLFGQLAPVADPGQPSWLLGGRLEREVHLHTDGTSDVKIMLSARALRAIIDDVAPAGNVVESGGILVGLRPRPSEVFITDAGGHGPRAERKPRSYKHDALHDIQLAQGLGQWAGLEELGGWHSHGVDGSDRPSPADLQAWAGMAEMLSKYRQTDPYVGLIVTAPRLPGSRSSGDWQHPTLTAWVTELGSQTARTPWYRCRRAPIETAS